MFLAGLGSKLGLYALGAVLIAAVVGGFWLHYNNLVEENAALQEDRAKAVQALEASQQAVNAMRGQLAEWRIEQDEFNSTLQKMAENQREASKERRRLISIFEKHDLDKLSHAKPVLIERRINRGTDDVIRMLESETALDRYKRIGRGGDGSETVSSTPAEPTGAEARGVESPDG